MKKYKVITLLIITFLVSVLSLDYFFYDIKSGVANLLNPSPMEMDPNNKISVLFENKIFVDGAEVQAMPLGTIVGEKDYHHGLMYIGGRKIVIAVKAYKTSDCKEDEIFAVFKLGEGTADRKFIFHAFATAKITNRVIQWIPMTSRDKSVELKIETIAYFGPPKQVAKYKPTLFMSAEAAEDKVIPVYQIRYSMFDKNFERERRGSVVIQENRIAGLESSTVSDEYTESLNFSMKIVKNANSQLQVDLYSVHKLDDHEERMIVTEDIKLNENSYFFDGRLKVYVEEFKKK